MFETIAIMALNYGKTVVTHPATRAAVNIGHTGLMLAVTYQNAIGTMRSFQETKSSMMELGNYTRTAVYEAREWHHNKPFFRHMNDAMSDSPTVS